jgi:uncharacterized protein (TIGR02588 family)
MSNAKAAQADTRDARHHAHPAEATSPWEWAVAALGLVLIVGAVGYLAYFALTTRSEPPSVLVTAESVAPSGEGYLVTVKAANRGGSTAAALTIEGTLMRDGSIVESSEATIDYLPRSSERQAGLFFTRDPSQYRLDLHPKGYANP